jgi:hypothetical protein
VAWKRRKSSSDYTPITPENPTGYYIFVKRCPERFCGFIQLPGDRNDGTDDIRLVNSMKEAHRYSNKTPPEMWIDMMKDQVKIDTTNDVREPEWTWIEV